MRGKKYNGNLMAIRVAVVLVFLCLKAVCPSDAAYQAPQTASQQASAEDAQQKAEPDPYQPPEETPEELAERVKHPATFAPERMIIAAPSDPVPVGAPLQIQITLAPGKLALPIMVVQQDASRMGIAPDDQMFRILAQEENERTIEVVPAQLGKVTLEFTTTYQDNAYVYKTITINVVPTAKELKKFSLGVPPTFPLALEGGEPNLRALKLWPQLTYEGLKDTIRLSDVSAIPLSIDQPEDDPIIRLDEKTGVVYPVRVGKVTIVGNIGGIKATVEITVFATEKDVRPLRRARQPKF